MKLSYLLFLCSTALLVPSIAAFSANEGPNSRRAFLSGMGKAVMTGAATAGVVAATTVQPASAAMNLGDPNSVVGREIRSFNSLIYEFKNTALDGGLDASKLKEPSIPFIDFGEKMKKGEVTFVEFMAPNGDVAYATFKGEKGSKVERMRIGQGYPISGKNSWSSPDYVIRSVSNFGVPYKFTVPGLEKYKS
mmetsp:Transcript_4594/g.6376  ORF Transcript_4594/g.6376 Transcript_4594/m.6376 type:complete len:192 (-) Transcript_4594:41-616(-)